jgi:hypothetical protein
MVVLVLIQELVLALIFGKETLAMKVTKNINFKNNRKENECDFDVVCNSGPVSAYCVDPDLTVFNDAYCACSDPMYTYTNGICTCTYFFKYSQ